MVVEESVAVAPVSVVLAAVADPVRLEMLRRLVNAGTPLRCVDLYENINKSTAAHHFKILREAGLTERRVIDGLVHQSLRGADVEEALPGFLGAVVGAANRAT